MKTLQMKSLKKSLIFIILFFALSVIMLASALPSLKEYLVKPVDLETIDFTDNIDGLYVTGTLYGVYDWYVEEELDGEIIGKEYLIDADDFYYIGMYAQHKEMDKAEELMEASWDYLNESIEYEELEPLQYQITGTIKKMPSDSIQFMHEYVGWDTLDDETRKMFLPYYIELNKKASSEDSSLGFLLAGAVFGILGIVLLILPFTGCYQKAIKKYLKTQGNSDMALEKVENFIQNTTEVNGLRYNNEFICGQPGIITTFGETDKLAWVYLQTLTHKIYFIPVGKTHSLMLGFSDGSTQDIILKKEEHAKEHMQHLSAVCPRAILGFTNELSNLFNRDLKAFLDLKYNQDKQEM